MNLHIQPLAALTSRAKQALIQELGVIDALRFLHQFAVGNGNYTLERSVFLDGKSVGGIVADIKANR